MRNRLIVAAVFLISSSAFAQKDQPAPQLGVADKVAISTLEKAKEDAKNSFNQAQQAEQAIFQEFAQAHPGYLIDPSNMTVTKIPPPAKPAEQPKK